MPKPKPKVEPKVEPKPDPAAAELKMLRVAVNLIADHLESKYSPGIFTPEERKLMGVPPRGDEGFVDNPDNQFG